MCRVVLVVVLELVQHDGGLSRGDEDDGLVRVRVRVRGRGSEVCRK